MFIIRLWNYLSGYVIIKVKALSLEIMNWDMPFENFVEIKQGKYR